MIKTKKACTFLLVKIFLIAVSLYCTIFVEFTNAFHDRVDLLFLLPFSFTIACLLSQKAIKYAKDSFGLLILYGVIVLRYLIAPVLITLSGTLVPNLTSSPPSLVYSISMMVIELFTVLITINTIWKPIEKSPPNSAGSGASRLYWTGILLFIVLVSLIFYRGTFSNVIEHLSFGFDYRQSKVDLKTYDMSAILTLKTVLFLLVITWLSKKYHTARGNISRKIYLILSLTVAVMNSIIYDATNRATMVMCAMASLTILIHFYGRKIERLLPVIAVIGFVFVWSLFSYGTLGVKAGESLIEKNHYIMDLSNVAELYSNGVSTEAHAYDMYDIVVPQITLETYISELIKSNSILGLPGLWTVGESVASIPSIQELYNKTLSGRSYILPNAGLALYSGRKYIGWLLDIIFHWLAVMGIYHFYRKKQLTHDPFRKYLYAYCEMICGFIIMNNIMIGLSLLTALPFLLFVFILVNETGGKIRLGNSIVKSRK